ncbi:hypothetical protein C7271_23230 [filamentous cyanobacterium CCP5]|nr:hypothetical protein C7271_23230 [filamentous cyanobacterium CCP5]
MQRTRLNTLLEKISDRFARWLVNPWRRLSILIISLLLGYFLGVAVSAFAGQAARQDIFVSALLVVIGETISRVVYSRNQPASNALWLEALNGLKIGAMYALCVEAFKLGS